MTAHEPVSFETIEVRNNAASLLYDLLGDEKNVSKILIIKRNSEELGRLIKAISEMAADEKKQLERLAAKNPKLNLHTVELPLGEKATREAVRKTEEHELLSTSGREFEFNLLFIQAQALNYGRHLAKIAAENSAPLNEARQFAAMSQMMQDLHSRVLTLMHREK